MIHKTAVSDIPSDKKSQDSGVPIMKCVASYDLHKESHVSGAKLDQSNSLLRY